MKCWSSCSRISYESNELMNKLRRSNRQVRRILKIIAGEPPHEYTDASVFYSALGTPFAITTAGSISSLGCTDRRPTGCVSMSEYAQTGRQWDVKRVDNPIMPRCVHRERAVGWTTRAGRVGRRHKLR